MTDYTQNSPGVNANLLANIEALTPLAVALIRKSANADVAASQYGIPLSLVTLLRTPAGAGETKWTKTRDANGVESYVATGWV